jgi:hypothetical protein
MGFYYRKRARVGKNTWLNVSKRGLSVSQRAGRFTFNSRGRTTVRLGNGLSYRGGCAVLLVVPVALAATALVATFLAVR